jgi:IS30 family transposase
MGKKYSHLSGEQRTYIETGLVQGLSLSVIAELLGVNRSTVWREVQRATRLGRSAYDAAGGGLAYTEGRKRNGLARRKH